MWMCSVCKHRFFEGIDENKNFCVIYGFITTPFRYKKKQYYVTEKYFFSTVFIKTDVIVNFHNFRP